jgi:hypothetical protein
MGVAIQGSRAVISGCVLRTAVIRCSARMLVSLVGDEKAHGDISTFQCGPYDFFASCHQADSDGSYR